MAPPDCAEEATAISDVKGRRTKRRRVAKLHAPAAASSSPASTEEEEEEDMANCLILLAQGRAWETNHQHHSQYECKTCSKFFPSFQALGGHRASHKRPKMAGDGTTFSAGVAPLPSPVATNSSSSSNRGRVHGCSICGSEFSSGQALGGHMRRHRTINATVSEQAHEEEEEERLLSFDLNLPAPPEDDHRGPATFAFGKTTQPLLFSAWVDCHY